MFNHQHSGWAGAKVKLCMLLGRMQRITDACNELEQVTHLAIFIEDNQGEEEETRVEAIRLFGSGGQSMNVADIKKAEDN